MHEDCWGENWGKKIKRKAWKIKISDNNFQKATIVKCPLHEERWMIANGREWERY